MPRSLKQYIWKAKPLEVQRVIRSCDHYEKEAVKETRRIWTKAQEEDKSQLNVQEAKRKWPTIFWTQWRTHHKEVKSCSQLNDWERKKKWWTQRHNSLTQLHILRWHRLDATVHWASTACSYIRFKFSLIQRKGSGK